MEIGFSRQIATGFALLACLGFAGSAFALDDAKPSAPAKTTAGSAKAKATPGTHKTAETKAKGVSVSAGKATVDQAAGPKAAQAKVIPTKVIPTKAIPTKAIAGKSLPPVAASAASAGGKAVSAASGAHASGTASAPKPKAAAAAPLPDGVPFSMQMPAAPVATAPVATAPPAANGPATTGALPPASSMPVGKVTGLPVPRYASLKTDRVNLREGPSKDNRTSWVFQRAGLPVEIVAEYETWRRIRDSAGTEGWVLHSLLSGRRTALVMPWAKTGADALPLLRSGDDKAEMVAQLQPNVIASVKGCKEGWCRVVVMQPGSDVSGYMRQDKLWGVYPNEKVE